MNELLSALILGVVEGLTEFIPVSSTGHLILAAEMLNFKGERAETFEIFIQLGAILAVVILYFPRFVALLDFKSGEGFSGFNGLSKLAVGCLPAFVLGAILHGYIKEYLFGPWTVALALVVGAIVMIIIERSRLTGTTLTIEAVSYRQAAIVGCVQCFALWPGMSRSASTIVGGMLAGLERKIAAEFSFLLAVPVMAAAVAFDLLQTLHLLQPADAGTFAVGFIASLVVAVIAIKFFLSLLNRFTLVPFACYRLVVGVLVLVILHV